MPNHANTRNIFFIRHGESESNVQENLAAGYNYNSPLTSLGKDQAKALVKDLRERNIF